MVNEFKVRELLQQQESEILDFKKETHAFSDDRKISEFIKDILAMANTPRDSSAYIVAGVDCLKDGSGNKNFCGVSEHPDDNDLQQRMNRVGVDPRPKFLYQPITVDGISYGVIEIFPLRDGPYVASKNFGSVLAHQIYFRSGTQNKEATSKEERRIWKWFLQETAQSTSKSEILPPATDAIPSWPELLQACYGFKKDRLYLLILGSDTQNEVTEEQWKFLGQLPLSLVLDFDSETRKGGAYHYVAPVLENNRAVHLRTYNDHHEFVTDRSCCWYAARGIPENKESLCEADWKSWNRKYGKYIRELIENFQKASESKYLTVLCLWDAREYINKVCDILDENFADNVNFVFASPNVEGLRTIAENYRSTFLSMPLSNVLVGIPRYIILPDQTNPEVLTIPKIKGQEFILSRQRLYQLSEDLEVLHSAIEVEEPPEPREIGRDFLRGMIVSWRDLSEHYDAERDQTDRIIEMLDIELRLRTTARFNIYHWPGSGGSTIGRQIAWKMHRKIPTVFLKRITPQVTIGRFRLIFEATELSILAIYEAADIEQDLVEALYAEARESNIPLLLVSIVRAFSLPSAPPNNATNPVSERSRFISEHLSTLEAFHFANAYKRVVPEKATDLEKLSQQERKPFWFALTAFENEFIGITHYVERRIELATKLQRDLMTFLALAYYYGHKSLRLDIFAEYLGLENRVRLEKLFPQPALHDLLVDDGDNMCRPAHYLIAEEILQSVLAGSGERTNWRVGLSTWAKSFIHVCSEGEFVASGELIEVLRSLFIRRNEHELPETETTETMRFSPLMEEIRKISHDSQKTVFQELADCFPYYAHFRAHLARFYSIQGQHQQAFEEMNKALKISPKDPLLHHMKGMCYRRQATSIMREISRSRQVRSIASFHQSAKTEADLRNIVEEAKTSFNVSLELALGSDSDYETDIDYAPTVEYALTSQIQLLLDVIDFGYKISGVTTRTEFIVSQASSWYQEQLDDVEYLMERLKSLREGDKPSRYILSRQRELDSIYDDHSTALQRWNSLIASARNPKYVSIIHRQIVVNLLERARKQKAEKEGKKGTEIQRSWDLLSQRDRQRAIELLEENLQANPSSERDIRDWFHAMRYLPTIDLSTVIEKVANWRATGDSLEADYYLYILYVLQAIDGNTTRLSTTMDLIKQTRMKAFSRKLRRNTFSFEWFGKGQGLMRLKHYTDLGEFDADKFLQGTTLLERLTGTVRYIEDPSSGTIELDCGIEAFFVPSRVNPEGLQKGIDEYTRVDFYIGFSYSGLRAWSVRKISTNDL